MYIYIHIIKHINTQWDDVIFCSTQKVVWVHCSYNVGKENREPICCIHYESYRFTWCEPLNLCRICPSTSYNNKDWMNHKTDIFPETKIEMNTMNTSSNHQQIIKIRAHLYLLQNVHPLHHLWDTEMLCISEVLTAQTIHESNPCLPAWRT